MRRWLTWYWKRVRKGYPPGWIRSDQVQACRGELLGGIFGGLGLQPLPRKRRQGHEMPAHHQIEEALDEYLARAEIKPHEPIFQSVTRAGTALTGRALNRHNA
jgi:hypothetical protein